MNIYNEAIAKLRTQSGLFELLNTITPRQASDLEFSYLHYFPPHPRKDEIISRDHAPLSNHQGYFFEPDRLTPMIKAVQNAVRQVAKIESGKIEVVDGGHGLGYVAIAALALNSELQNRVRITGIENNPATFERANEIYEFYNIPKEWYDLQLGTNK